MVWSRSAPLILCLTSATFGRTFDVADGKNDSICAHKLCLFAIRNVLGRTKTVAGVRFQVQSIHETYSSNYTLPMEVNYTKIAAVIFMGLLTFNVSSQTQSSGQLSENRTTRPDWEISGFIDAYYAADLLDNTDDKAVQPFLFNHNRNREFQINLAMLKVAATSDYYRAVVHLQTGTYAFDNYAAEPILYQTLYEAYAGIALNKRQTSWLDFGIFESHIGYESAISIRNYTLTRSLMAENSPYYLTGARLTYKPNKQWLFRIILCNGWQRIQRPDEQRWPALGTQVNYKWSNFYTLNWSTYIGSEFPLGDSRHRIFNSFYLQGDLPSQWGWILAVDFGYQEVLSNDNWEHWYAASALISYPLAENWKMAMRAERFRDLSAFVIGPDFSAWAGSVNIDYSPVSQVAFRSELKFLFSDLDFRSGQSHLILTTSIAVTIGAE